MTDKPKPEKPPAPPTDKPEATPPKPENNKADAPASASVPPATERKEAAEPKPAADSKAASKPAQAESASEAKPASAEAASKPESPAKLAEPTAKPAEASPVPGSTTRDLKEYLENAKEVTHPSKSNLLNRLESKEDTSVSGPSSSSPSSLPPDQKPTERVFDPRESQPPAEGKQTQRVFDPGASQPPAQPAASAVQICPTCGHRNRPGVLICENCGTNLMTGSKSAIGTRDLMREQESQVEGVGEKLLDTSEARAVETAGGSVFTEDMVLRIEIEGGSTPMLVYPKQEIIMGRRDPNTGGMPDVDLTAYAGYRMGVSRRHAAVRLQDKQLHVSDLGSSNGTFLNGTRLTAHRPYQLRDGDEVRLGQMVLRLYFQSNKDRK